MGPLIRELKQLNPRVSMHELRELGRYDIRRLPVLPRSNGCNGCVGALLSLCPNTKRQCCFGMIPEGRMSEVLLRNFIRELKPVLERTV